MADHPWTTEGVFCADEEARFARAMAGSEADVPRTLAAQYASGKLRPSELAIPTAIIPVARRLASAAGHEAVVAACNMTPESATAVHGDSRLDNMLFVTLPAKTGERDGRASGDDESCGQRLGVIVVDWAHLGYQTGLWDVAYFCATSVRIADRRAWIDELLHAYHRELLLTPRLDGSMIGPDDFSMEQCWREYRAASARVWNYYLGAGFTRLVAHPPPWMSEHMAPMLQSFVERIAWQVLDTHAPASEGDP